MKGKVKFMVAAASVLVGTLALLMILDGSKVSGTRGGGLAVRLDGFSGYTNRTAPNDTAVFLFTNVHPFTIEFVVYEHPTRVTVSRGILRRHEMTNLFLSLSAVPSWLQINYERREFAPYRELRDLASQLKIGRKGSRFDFLVISDEMRIPETAEPIERPNERPARAF